MVKIKNKERGFTPLEAKENTFLEAGKLRLQTGFTAILATFLVLLAMVTIAVSSANLLISQSRYSNDKLRAAQAYYTAEAGVEDALLRIIKGKQWLSPYSFNFGQGLIDVEISNVVGGARTITSKGQRNNRFKKIQVAHSVTSDKISFYYGAQIGDGGMIMENNSKVLGNVFSNGSVIASGKGYINGTIKVATIGSRIEGLEVQGDAYTHNCKDSDIDGSLYFSGGANDSCTATGGVKDHPTQATKALPISLELVDEWKNKAAEGGVVADDYVLNGGDTEYLGPKKIVGNMTIGNNATLVLTGMIWVTGDISIQNGATINIDPNVYKGLSGTILTDGQIVVNQGVILEGSGLEGSYLLLLSTNSSLDPLDPAIEVGNTASGGVFYTTNGLIALQNNVLAREVVGYKVYLAPNAVVSYEAGLADVDFSSGPGGSWEITSWREIE